MNKFISVTLLVLLVAAVHLMSPVNAAPKRRVSSGVIGGVVGAGSVIGAAAAGGHLKRSVEFAAPIVRGKKLLMIKILLLDWIMK